MKKHLLTAALAIVAIGGVFAMKAEPNKGSKTLSNQIVYYTELGGQACQASEECSDIPSSILCTAIGETTYDDEGCRTPSAFKYYAD